MPQWRDPAGLDDKQKAPPNFGMDIQLYNLKVTLTGHNSYIGI